MTYVVEERTASGWQRVRGYRTEARAFSALRENAEQRPGATYRVRAGGAVLGVRAGI